MPPEYGSPEEWMEYAKADLALASVPLPQGARYEQLCFHAQQAAEKALKAVLVHRGVEFPRTHSIAALLDLLPEDMPGPSELRKAAALTGYASFLRYPVGDPGVTEDRYRGAVRLAQAVVAWGEGVVSTETGVEPDPLLRE